MSLSCKVQKHSHSKLVMARPAHDGYKIMINFKKTLNFPREGTLLHPKFFKTQNSKTPKPLKMLLLPSIPTKTSSDLPQNRPEPKRPPSAKQKYSIPLKTPKSPNHTKPSPVALQE